MEGIRENLKRRKQWDRADQNILHAYMIFLNTTAKIPVTFRTGLNHSQVPAPRSMRYMVNIPETLQQLSMLKQCLSLLGCGHFKVMVKALLFVRLELWELLAMSFSLSPTWVLCLDFVELKI